MCRILYINNKDIFKQQDYKTLLTNSGNQNPHGMGLTTGGPAGIQVYKTLDKDEALAAIENALNQDFITKMIIHFRYATSGEMSLDQCHPVRTNHESTDELLVIHNGIIDGLGNEVLSDTQDFANMINGIGTSLDQTNHGNIYTEEYDADVVSTGMTMIDLLKCHLGGNKILLVHKPTGNIQGIGAQYGQETDGGGQSGKTSKYYYNYLLEEVEI